MREMYMLQSTKEAPNFGESVTAKFAEFLSTHFGE
jgi:hypothetical protein